MLHIAYKYQRATQLKIPIMIIAVLVLRFCREHIYKLCFCINSCCFSQFFAARCYASVRPMRSCVDCLSVCLSVTFVDHIKTNKHIIEIFSPSDSHSVLVFPTKRGGPVVIFQRGRLMQVGKQKTRLWTNICLRCIQVYRVVNRTSGEV